MRSKIINYFVNSDLLLQWVCNEKQMESTQMQCVIYVMVYSILFRGSRNTPGHLILQEPEINDKPWACLVLTGEEFHFYTGIL